MKVSSYDDELLYLAVDLAQRMLPAFDTPTGSVTKLFGGHINILFDYNFWEYSSALVSFFANFYFNWLFYIFLFSCYSLLDKSTS